MAKRLLVALIASLGCLAVAWIGFKHLDRAGIKNSTDDAIPIIPINPVPPSVERCAGQWVRWARRPNDGEAADLSLALFVYTLEGECLEWTIPICFIEIDSDEVLVSDYWDIYYSAGSGRTIDDPNPSGVYKSIAVVQEQCLVLDCSVHVAYIGAGGNRVLVDHRWQVDLRTLPFSETHAGCTLFAEGLK